MKLDKIKFFLEQSLLIIAKNIFLCFLLLLLLSLLLGGFVFYKYILSPQEITLNTTEEPFVIKEAIHQKILEKWQIRENKFRKADLKEYSNPFDKPVLPSAEELTE